MKYKTSVKRWMNYFDWHNPCKINWFTFIIWAIWPNNIWWVQSRRAAWLNHFISLQVSRALNQQLNGSVEDPGFIDGKLSFYGFKTPLSSLVSSYVSSCKTCSINHIPISFFICPPSICSAEINVFTWVLHFDQSPAELIKNSVCCRVNWPRCKCQLYTFP